MKTIVFVVGPALGHVGRSLVIARALRKINSMVRIVFIHITPGAGSQLLPQEFECVSLGYVDRGDEKFAADLGVAIAKLNPALTCFDLTPLPWLQFFDNPNMPCAYITNFFLTSLRDFNTVQTQYLNERRQDVNQRRERLGLKPIYDAKSLYHRQITLLCDPVQLVPDLDLASGHFTAVGHCAWQPNSKSTKEIRLLQRPILNVFGSTGRIALAATVERIRTALFSDGVIVISGREQVDSERVGWFCYSGIPVSSALERAVFSITQGGAGSTYISLAAGVPVAVSPEHRNHEIMAEVLSENGVGINLRELAQKTETEIRRYVAMMRENCVKQFRETRDDGPLNAAAALQTML